jgi:tRNA1(Val) A37 N6-methylase TrmN6
MYNTFLRNFLLKEIMNKGHTHICWRKGGYLGLCKDCLATEKIIEYLLNYNISSEKIEFMLSKCNSEKSTNNFLEKLRKNYGNTET